MSPCTTSPSSLPSDISTVCRQLCVSNTTASAERLRPVLHLCPWVCAAAHSYVAHRQWSPSLPLLGRQKKILPMNSSSSCFRTPSCMINLSPLVFHCTAPLFHHSPCLSIPAPHTLIQSRQLPPFTHEKCKSFIIRKRKKGTKNTGKLARMWPDSSLGG